DALGSRLDARLIPMIVEGRIQLEDGDVSAIHRVFVVRAIRRISKTGEPVRDRLSDDLPGWAREQCGHIYINERDLPIVIDMDEVFDDAPEDVSDPLSRKCQIRLGPLSVVG